MRYLSTSIFILLLLTTFLFADKKHSKTIPFESNLKLDVDPFIQNIVSQVSGDSILSYLQQLESLGLKNPGSTALQNTRDWLFSKYQSYGYTDITYHDFNYSSYTLQNIIVNKTGTVQPDVTLIIDGHYDTIGGPGVNDNGSGVAVILEVARLLANVDCEYTIKFINFSAEEQGLIGSQAYVTNVVIPQNMNILFVFNIDEVGGDARYVNNTITCERDQDNQNGNDLVSAAYTDTLATLTQEYSNLNTQIAHAYGSDYIPFENAGYVITGYFETNVSPYPHGPNDILANMDPPYVTEITKGAVAAALHFARAENLNHAPQIVYFYPQNLDTLEIGSQQSFEIRAEDVDGDSLIYSIIYKDQVIMDSVATFTFLEAGLDTVFARVEDGKGKVDVYEWLFYVNDPASSINDNIRIAEKYYLYAPSPNPFNPSTKITYEITEPGKVEINVYNINGQKIAELTNRFHRTGKYSVEFNGLNYSSGIYIINMKAKDIHLTRKVLLIK